MVRFSIAPILILCTGKMAAIFPMFGAQIDSVAATMSVFVGATIPESLMAHCQGKGTTRPEAFIRYSVRILFYLVPV